MMGESDKGGKAQKGLAALIIGGPEDPEKDGGYHDEALDSAVDDLIESIHAKDRDGVKSALRYAVECLAHDDGADDHDGDEY